ncbi:hypothetical protein [Rhizobium etli]|uniref:hypothetical protein n=1 Tax=Rhizobium etli TaxID=29449 RepID=UPI0002DDC1C4|nr:hypothetical protein [Rhizobium etli]
MTSNDNLMLYAKLGGFRLAVIANSICCDGDFSRVLHDRLLDGLDAAIGQLRTIMALERAILHGDDKGAVYQLKGEVEIFGRTTVDLLDELDIDHETHEYRINGGYWSNALTADDGGVHIEYPTLISLGDEELGSLAPIILAITKETGLTIRAGRIDYGMGKVFRPNHACGSERT